MTRRRTSIAKITLTCCVLATGCSTNPPTAPDLPAALLARNGPPVAIAVVPARYAPESNLAVWADNSGSGAAQGAMDGMVAGLRAIPSALMLPWGTLAALVLVPALPLIGLVGGAFGGTQAAIPPETAAAIENIVKARLDELRVSESTARGVAASIEETGVLRGEVLVDEGPTAAAVTPDYRALAVRGFGAVIEVRVRRVVFTRQGRGADPNLALVVTAGARLFDVATGKLISSRHFAYQSPTYESSRWAQDAGNLVGTEFGRAQAVLGERIVESLLLGAEWSPLSRAGPLRNIDVCALPPTAPASVNFITLRPSETIADARSPILAWETFPLAPWVEADSRLGKAENVRYELRIWEASDRRFLGELVYERSDLLSPNHRLESELKPATQYFWSVRARYAVGGLPQATRWSAAQEPVFVPTGELISAAAESRMERDEVRSSPCAARNGFGKDISWTPCRCLDFIPAANYYRFWTP